MMERRLAKVLIVTVLLAALGVSSAWGDGKQVTILYSNNINGQIYSVG
jgi:hypothetical protein